MIQISSLIDSILTSSPKPPTFPQPSGRFFPSSDNDINKMSKNMSIRLVLRKLESPYEREKVTLVIQSSLKVQRISSARVIRQGVAKFFGEEVILPCGVDGFTFLLLQESGDRLLAKFVILPEVVSQFSARRNVFTCSEDNFKLTWEAQLIVEGESKNNDNTDRDLNDLGYFQENQDHLKSLQPAETIRRRRKSFKSSKVSDAISQPGCTTNFSTNTHEELDEHASFDQKNVHADGCRRLGIPSISPIEEVDFISRKTTSKSRSHRKTPIHSPSKYTAKNSAALDIRTVKRNRGGVVIGKSVPPEIRTPCRAKLQKHHRVSLLDRFGMREIMYMGLVGIISGITAAQI